MPTPVFNWSQPTVGQTSWHSFLVATVGSVAAAIQSYEAALYPRHASICSMYPSNSMGIQYEATGLGPDGTSRWTTVSFAPYGPCVNTFTVVRSGFRSYFEFIVKANAPIIGSTAAGSKFTRLLGYWEGHISPGSLVLFGYSGWVSKFYIGAVRSFSNFSVAMNAVTSLAPGTYALTLQYRGFHPWSGALGFFPGFPHGISIVHREVL